MKTVALTFLIVFFVLVILSLALLAGCGVGADFDNPVVVQCTNGRTLDLREWKPYMGVGGPNFLENKKTGEQIVDDGTVKCYPVQK